MDFRGRLCIAVGVAGIAALSIFATARTPEKAAEPGAAPLAAQQPTGVNGEAAVEQLKATGRYDSLMEAVDAAQRQVREAKDEKGGLFAHNPSQRYVARFGSQDLELQFPKAEDEKPDSLRMTVTSFGRQKSLLAPPSASPKPRSEHAVTVRTGALEEWYENDPQALRQWFKVHERPAGEGELRVEMKLAEGWTATGGGQSATLSGPGPELNYSELKVWDADGKELPARIEADGQLLALAVNDTNATYPVTIDPTFKLEQKLVPPGKSGEGDWFGISVDLDGVRAIVGAPYAVNTVPLVGGMAYVFLETMNGWELEYELEPADSDNFHLFGISVALSGGTAMVGATGDDEIAPNSGAAYLFARRGTVWVEEAKLKPGSLEAADILGSAIDVDGDTAVVGLARDDDKGIGAGAVFVYQRSGTDWDLQAKIYADDASAGDFFGDTVAVDGDIVAIGASFADHGGNVDAGAGYLFQDDGSDWKQIAKLTASDSEADDYLGGSVDLDGDTVVFGARGEDGFGNNRGAAYVYVQVGTVWKEEGKLIGASADSEGFGAAVALYENTLVVGEPRSDDNGFDSGVAYVFTRSGGVWTPQQELEPNDPQVQQFFGISVAAGKDVVLVGAYFDSQAALGSGSTYFFTRSGTTWSQDQKVENPSTRSSGPQGFGLSVAISGDTAIVGASLDEDLGDAAGAAYVFVESGNAWTLQAKLTADNGAPLEYFGDDVDLDGDVAVVGADLDDDKGDEAGSAFVFRRSGQTWKQEAQLFSPVASSGDRFGDSVAIDGKTIVVGAPQTDSAGSNSGSAFVFVESGGVWNDEATLEANDADADDNFGGRVALDGDTAIVGAFGNDDAGGSSGSAYIFTRSGSTWNQEAKLTANDAAQNDFFGSAVDVWRDLAVVGARGNDDGGSSSGSAYVFERSGSSWSQVQKLLPDDPTNGRSFGYSVAVEAEKVIVSGDGSTGNDEPHYVYAFERGGQNWKLREKFNAEGSSDEISLGVDIDLSGDALIVGSSSDDATFTDSGSAWVFRFVNEPPTIVDPGPQTIKEESSFVLQLSATDPDAPDTLSFTLDDGPTGLTLSNDGLLEWTPTEAQGPIVHTVGVSVSDGVAADSVQFKVTVEEVNREPVLDPLGPFSAKVGKTLTFNATATDPDIPANKLTFSLLGEPAGASISSDGDFSWTPSEADLGEHTFEVVVSDDGTPPLQDDTKVTVTVEPDIVNFKFEVDVPGYVGAYEDLILKVGVFKPGTDEMISSHDLSPDSRGVASLDLPNDGKVDVRVRAQNTLFDLVEVDLDADPQAFFTLVLGDTDASNTVGSADYLALVGAWGTSEGDGNWNPLADFDGNGTVGSSDFLILVSNWAKVGD
jgi:hypothetical protein